MKKLVLDAESLEVESFAAATVMELRATVHAHEATMDSPCELSVDPSSCGTCAEMTCDRICPETAYATCSRFCSPTADCP
jgi:hypothetical protein